MDLENKIINNEILISVEKSIISKDAVIKCTYWYSDNFTITINDIEDKYFRILLKPNNSNAISNIEKYFLKIQKDLIDFNLRDIVSKETKDIRELLIAKAFSHFNTEEVPPPDE